MFTRILMMMTLVLTTALAGLAVFAGLLAQSPVPSALPSPTPTLAPLVFPTAESTDAPVIVATPTSEPLPTSTAWPTLEPTAAPTEVVEVEPEIQPTTEPVVQPTTEVIPPRNLGLTVLPMDEDYHSQLTETSLPNACGPTSLFMVLDYYNLEDSLSEVIAYHQAIPPAEGGYDPYCTLNGVCTSPAALAQVAETIYGLSVEARQGWTLEEVAQSLQAGFPVIADVNWRLVPGNFGHFVVIYGVDTDTETVFYHDPYDGRDRQATWAQFYAAWNGPIDIGDPLQPEGHRLWGMAVMHR